MNNKVLAFCHIVKASGTTVSSILRRNHGLRHLDVISSGNGKIYHASDLRRDIALFKHLKSISGHGLRPHVDFSEYDERLWWFSWMREPLARLISGYQHAVERKGVTTCLKTWLEGDNHRNVQVRYFSGADSDLETAKQVILKKLRFVGLVERFDESLVMLARFAPGSLRVDYSRPSNTSRRGSMLPKIAAEIERNKDLIDDSIRLDRELYHWVKSDIYPHYVANYGEKQLDRDRKQLVQHRPTRLDDRMRDLASTLRRKFWYEPMISRRSAT